MESKFGIGDRVAAKVLGSVVILGTICNIEKAREDWFFYDVFSKENHTIYKFIPENRIVLCNSSGETIVDIINQ